MQDQNRLKSLIGEQTDVPYRGNIMMKCVISKTNKQTKETTKSYVDYFLFHMFVFKFVPGLLDSVLASPCFLLNLVICNLSFSSSPVTLFQAFDQVFV